MGFACPVCEEPQADGAHLANHLAFTALLHDDDHADWLAEVAPGWSDRTPEALADEIVDYAETIEVETVTAEETAAPHVHHRSNAGPRDPSVQRVVDEAIEMTRERLDEESEEE